MNQFQWTFLDNQRRRHTLGIAHGATSGHLVVHCDHRVVLIDFSVLEPRTFSFFVEDELCRLSINGDAEAGFTYDFQLDMEVDTAVNRARNAERKKQRREGLVRGTLFFLAPVAILGAILAWGYLAFLDELPTRILQRGVRSVAAYQADGDLQFFARGEGTVTGTPLQLDPDRIAALGLGVGDSLPVLFYGKNPEHFIVDWARALNGSRPNLPGLKGDLRTAVFSVLGEQLPATAGSPECALATAGMIGGAGDQLALVDAFVLGDEADRVRWRARFADPAYVNRLDKACPGR